MALNQSNQVQTPGKKQKILNPLTALFLKHNMGKIFTIS